jgi:hypothetical protein
VGTFEDIPIDDPIFSLYNDEGRIELFKESNAPGAVGFMGDVSAKTLNSLIGGTIDTLELLQDEAERFIGEFSYNPIDAVGNVIDRGDEFLINAFTGLGETLKGYYGYHTETPLKQQFIDTLNSWTSREEWENALSTTLELGMGGVGWKSLDDLGIKSIDDIAPKSTINTNRIVGNQFDDYVAGTKLQKLDDLGQLGRQERLPTPEFAPGKNYVKPDYTIYDRSGNAAAYADAKSGAISFDAQAKGLIEWSTTTKSNTLIYYTPRPTTIPRSMIQYARDRGVSITVKVVE